MIDRRDFFRSVFSSIPLPTSEPSSICKQPLVLWVFVATWAPWANGASDWEQICVSFASLVMWVILIVYTIVPELKNLNGLIFRAYIATYIGIYTCIAAHYFTLTSSSPSHDMFFYVALNYCAVSCALWLNVMSFNIWRTFRAIRSANCHNKEQERKKFIFYAIYAWAIPIALSTIIASVICLVSLSADPFDDNEYSAYFIHYSAGGIIGIVLICNTCMYISTALRIQRQKKDTSHLAVGVNKHRESGEQWFNLYVKLFLIMGGHMILWMIFIFWTSEFWTSIIATVEMVQSIIIFFIFIWKDSVKRSLRTQLGRMLHWLQNLLRRNVGNPTTRS